MLTRKVCLLIAIMLIFMACGPETIFVRPSLDTPDRHTTNGQALLEQGKYQHALREFKRANELDPQNLDAMIGMAVTLGYCDNLDQGLLMMQKAGKMAVTPQDQAKVHEGRVRLQQIRPNQKK